MRRILIENARRKQSLKRGGDRKKMRLTKLQLESDDISDPDILLELDEALEKLSQQDELKADLVKLRFFAGLTLAQAAQALGISSATADRYWSFARSWLYVEISS
jgi:RNA polymerase sigma factor (TIGR02999 family)